MAQNLDTNNPQNHNNSSDEIDLRELFKAIGNFFKNIFLSFMYGIIAIKTATLKHIKLIIILCVIGGAVGILLHFSTKEYYSSSMLFSSKYSSRKLIENSITKLDQLCKEENYAGLASILNIDSSQVKNIQGFSYEPFVTEEEIVELEVLKEQLSNQIEEEEIIQKFVDKLSSDFNNTYRVSINVFDNKKISNLEEPLLNYFRNNEYVLKRINSNQKSIRQEIKEIEKELKEIDSMKSLMIKNFNRYSENSDPKATNNIFLSDERWKDPMQVFNESQSLYQRKISLERQLEIKDEFEMIDGFTAFAKPESPSLLALGFYTGLIGIGIAYLLIMLISFNNYLNKLAERKGSKALN